MAEMIDNKQCFHKKKLQTSKNRMAEDDRDCLNKALKEELPLQDQRMSMLPHNR